MRNIFEVINDSVFAWLDRLRDEAKTLVRDEIQLLKGEAAEKAMEIGRTVAMLAGAGALVYAGVLLLLIALGLLTAFGFAQFGWNPLLAAGAGIGCIGLLVLVIGGIIALTQWSSVSMRLSGLRQKLPELKNPAAVHESAAEETPRSPAELRPEIKRTQRELKHDVRQAGHRLSPSYAKQRIEQRIRAHPYRWNLAAAGTGMFGGALLKRRFHRHEESPHPGDGDGDGSDH